MLWKECATEASKRRWLFETAALDKGQHEKVVTRFRADRDEEYRELLGRCADFEAEIEKETAALHFTYAEVE
jgi:hypothetical protein